MQHVCHTLIEVWSLPVLSDCMTEEHVCTATCMTHTMMAMGITTHVHGQHPPPVYAPWDVDGSLEWFAMQPRHGPLSLAPLDCHTRRVDPRGICVLAPTARGIL